MVFYYGVGEIGNAYDWFRIFFRIERGLEVQHWIGSNYPSDLRRVAQSQLNCQITTFSNKLTVIFKLGVIIFRLTGTLS